MEIDAAWNHASALLLAAVEPEFTGAVMVRILSRILHILSAIILGGGLFYLRTILAPAGVNACFADRRAIWARWIAVASLLLIVTGLFNYMVIIRETKDLGEKLPTSYHILLGVKMLLGLGVMFIASILAGKTAAADRFRADLRKWLNVAWMGVIAIVVIGAVLRMYHAGAEAEAAPNSPPAVEGQDGQES